MGAGSIGLMTLLWARFSGARAIVVSELQLDRREVALKLGADTAVDPRMHSPVRRDDSDYRCRPGRHLRMYRRSGNAWRKRFLMRRAAVA